MEEKKSLSQALKDKFGIPSIEYYDKKQNELHEQFIEMGQLKSDFDIDKFTSKKDGNFIAHNFHMLMRQYVLALSEAKRMLLDHKEKLRQIDILQEMLDSCKEDKKKLTTIVYTSEGNKKEVFVDIEIERLVNQIRLLEVTMTNKLAMVDRFEKVRLKLIEMNGGKAPTNEQHQAEEPEYWKWFLEKKALFQSRERLTGIREGIWENISLLEESALLNPEFQVKVLENGRLNLPKIEKEIAAALDQPSAPMIEKQGMVITNENS